jgi:hypothetical protein
MAKKAEVRPSVIRCPVLCFVCVSADFPNLRIGRGLSFQSLPTLLPPCILSLVPQSSGKFTFFYI